MCLALRRVLVRSFAIDGTTGVVTVANGTLLDAESSTSHNITVLATSSDGSINSTTFAVAVTNLNDNPVVGPTDTDGASGGSVAENAANGTAVGITAHATDADLGATIRSEESRVGRGGSASG